MHDVYVAGIGITTFTRLEYPLAEIVTFSATPSIDEILKIM